MKKKRFIKLLMGEYCVSRNTARNYAESIQRRGDSYLAELTKWERMVRQVCTEFGIPRSMLYSHKRGAGNA